MRVFLSVGLEEILHEYLGARGENTLGNGGFGM